MIQRASKIVLSVTIGMVVILFASAFVLSYEALKELALENGIRQGLGWLWPLGLDAFMAVASLYMLWAFLTKEWSVLPLMMVMVCMGSSVVFNVLHAPQNNLARSVAALPPLVAFMTFEVFIIMVRHYVDKQGMQPGEQAENGWTTADERRALLANILAANGREWTKNELADELGVSRTTVSRDLESMGVDL